MRRPWAGRHAQLAPPAPAPLEQTEPAGEGREPLVSAGLDRELEGEVARPSGERPRGRHQRLEAARRGRHLEGPVPVDEEGRSTFHDERPVPLEADEQPPPG